MDSRAEIVPQGCPGSGLPRSRRITRSRSFEETYARGVRVIGQNMVLWLSADPDGCLRLGVVAGRKVGGAVARNRAKRMLREIFRVSRALFAPGHDVILIARRPIIKASFAEARDELIELAGRIKLLKSDMLQRHDGKNPDSPDKSL